MMWTETETRTETIEHEFELVVRKDRGACMRYLPITPELLRKALESNAELREAVDKQRIPWAQGLQKAHDEWRSRAEEAETDRAKLANCLHKLYVTVNIVTGEHWAQDGVAENMTARLIERFQSIHDRALRAEQDLAAAIAQRREAERERDFQRDCRHREERELGAARERLVTIIDEAFGPQPVMGGTIDDMLTALEHHLFEQRKRYAALLDKAERERDEARAEAEKLRVLNASNFIVANRVSDQQRETIARLESWVENSREIERALGFDEPHGMTLQQARDLIRELNSWKARAHSAEAGMGEATVQWNEAAEALTELRQTLEVAEGEHAKLERELAESRDQAQYNWEHLNASEETVAELQRQLTEAQKAANADPELDRIARVIRAMAEWTEEARAGLVREIHERWPETKLPPPSGEVSDYYRARHSQWAAQFAADAEELSAWRTVAMVLRHSGKRLCWFSGNWLADDLSNGPQPQAPTITGLAKRLGLLGGEGAGDKNRPPTAK